MRFPLLTALLLAALPARALEPYPAQWTPSAALEGDGVTLALDVRYVACGMVLEVVRVEPDGTQVTVWQGDDETALDTLDAYVGCACEPLGTSHGTGQKNCPEQTCTKDELCACTRRCAPVHDACPPAGTVTWRFVDRDGAAQAQVSLDVPADLPGCTAPVDLVVAEPAPASGGGGCRAGGAAGGPAGVALLLLLALGLGTRRPGAAAVLALGLALLPATGCGRKEAKAPEAAAKPAPDAGPRLEAPPMTLEGTPWEEVVTLQAELLEFLETAESPENVMREVRHWKKKNLPAFQAACKAALDHYAARPEHRLGHLVKSGRAWAVVKQRIREISKDWPPAEKHDAEILLGEFYCR